MTEYDQFIVLNYAQLYQDMFFLSPIEPAMPRTVYLQWKVDRTSVYSGGVAASNHWPLYTRRKRSLLIHTRFKRLKEEEALIYDIGWISSLSTRPHARRQHIRRRNVVAFAVRTWARFYCRDRETDRSRSIWRIAVRTWPKFNCRKRETDRSRSFWRSNTQFFW